MPSKIVDYFGARRPILAFAPRDSEMRQVLEAAGMSDFASDERDVPAGAAALERLWNRFQANTLACDAERTRFWSSKTQIPKFLDLLAGSVRAANTSRPAGSAPGKARELKTGAPNSSLSKLQPV